MYRQMRLRLATLVLLVVGLCSANSSEAFAESTVEVLPAPTVQPNVVYAHGDASVSIGNGNCSTYPEKSEENGVVTIASDGTVLSKIPRVEGEWDTHPCADEVVAGFDNTTYVVQVGPASKNYPHRVVAERNNVRLWSASFVDPAGCSNRTAYIRSMALAKDGNLYADIYWPYVSKACPEKEAFSSMESSSGAVRFTKALPNIGSGLSSLNEIMPYENGVAILDGSEVFYFDYEGNAESGKTFIAAGSEESVIEAKIVPNTGRVYWYTQIYNVKLNEFEKFFYYRDPESSGKKEVKLPAKQWLANIFTTPYNGVVAEWKECHLCEAKGFDYINEEGSVVYEKNLTSETGYIVQEAGLAGGTLIDDFGNVIVRRIMDENTGDHDRNVVIDSFSPAGIKTRLLNSSSLGTKGKVDSFTSTSPLTQSMGKGRIYLTLCHEQGKITEGCSSSMNPEVVAIADTTIGEYDYSRSAIFSAGLEKLSYVALGDSYSAGEGVPSFIPPSDSDGCHRSYDAYSSVLAATLPSLRLDAFVACSGAKTTDLGEIFKGESPQLYSLGSSTDVVTVTIGGNDIGFGAFALECVIGTCDSSSAAYLYSMEQIEMYLPEELAKAYGSIHKYAENAEVYVLGYPQVVSESEPECGLLFAKSEEKASREVVSALDGKIKEAAEAAEGDFKYVDPNGEGSPFVGHELCAKGSESYFNGLEFPEHEYSFHPNQRGQQAYAELVAEAL